MSDPLDRASQLETEERHRLVASHRARLQEPPHEDEHGRYCVDCEATIPVVRVTKVNAVRCVECQTVRERREAIRVGRHY